MAAMPSPEVLELTTAVFLTAGATRAKSCRLTSRSSSTASKTQSASLSCPQSSSKLPGRSSPRSSGRCSGLGLSFLRVSRAFLARTLRSAAPAGTMSSSATSMPAAARWAATWAPMVPAPRTTVFLMSSTASLPGPRGPFGSAGPTGSGAGTLGGPPGTGQAVLPSYIVSMTSLYFCSTKRRLTLSVGVSSPASSVNSLASRVTRLIFSNWARSLVRSRISLS